MKIMKNTLRYFLVLLLSGMSAGYVSAQHHVNVHVGTSLPLGDFGDDDFTNDEAAGAATGFLIGGQYSYQFTDFGLGVFAGLDILYHPLSDKYRDDIFDYYQSEGLYGTEQNFYEYINVPTTVGLHYYFKGNEKFGLLANTGLTMNLLQMTNYEVEYQDYTVTTTFLPSYAVGIKAGAGVIVMEKLTFMVDYFANLPNDIEGEVDAPGQDSETVEGEIKVSMLNFSLGYRF